MLDEKPDLAKAQGYFECALAVARAVMSLARLWRDQGKPQQARELLAPVYQRVATFGEWRSSQEAKRESRFSMSKTHLREYFQSTKTYSGTMRWPSPETYRSLAASALASAMRSRIA